ncbi:GNAT family N-acetyltransferase [Roseateles violae]|uniref:GNAT family N-acetyltransferase n=1 Tax=Roseateles violae TaxID=3058042 RepID=A0ABT8DLD8_9BURK|nr:GNAT family N-acetyltransferase [Pelomonas sp. PFR6]MDN3919224.1 GNAT family N-acetyltransferase [Pelomonas sp. PFR6]
METTLAERAELAGLNASAPPQQARVDGWLIRLSPGKAKRSRCVNAIAAGEMPLDEVLRRCRDSFGAAGLPLIVRITPFSQPADLDAQLAARGWYSFDPTDVMVLDALPPCVPGTPAAPLRALSGPDYARLVGQLRGSSGQAIAAHAERMAASPVPYQGYALYDADAATLLCCGQIAREGELVGLYDIFTPPAQRGRGHAARLCGALLEQARADGARQAYLQVSADNLAAQRVYARLGFRPAYRYHYRSDDPAACA